MHSGLFPLIDGLLGSGDVPSALDRLAEEFRAQREYALLFEARLMKSRSELGLALIQTQAVSDFPEPARSLHEKATIDAAREAGQLFLADGEIERAWPYFRAIGETEPVSEAIEHAEPGEQADGVIAIALYEGVNPARGLELILQTHGMCRAITSFGMYAVQKDRERCIGLLARHLHQEIEERVSRAIESVEGAPPSSRTFEELFQARPWLFGEYDYYVDTSHLTSVLAYCAEVKDAKTLELFLDFCDYGQRLSSNFQSRGEPPFESPFVDYGYYIRALLGRDLEAQLDHFRTKLAAYDPQDAAMGPAQVLINLLVRLGRYEEAFQVSEQYTPEPQAGIPFPSSSQLCFLAGDLRRLRELAKNRGDVLTYFAASAQTAV